MNVIERWHELVEKADPSLLDELLAPDCVFHSPVVHTPQHGAELTRLYLTGAMHVLGAGDGFRYEREIIGESNACLEFVTEVDGIIINGVDLIAWNQAGQITDFKVMIRPLKAINLLHGKMKSMLEQLSDGFRPQGQ